MQYSYQTTEFQKSQSGENAMSKLAVVRQTTDGNFDEDEDRKESRSNANTWMIVLAGATLGLIGPALVAIIYFSN